MHACFGIVEDLCVYCAIMCVCVYVYGNARCASSGVSLEGVGPVVGFFSGSPGSLAMGNGGTIIKYRVATSKR